MVLDRMEKLDDRTEGRKLLIILTLKRHLHGIWITKLVERLKESLPPSSSFKPIEIAIRSLEDWLAEGWPISDNVENNDGHEIIGIVNRVSDAAPPALFKACCAVLATAEQSLNIPVWNGSNAYSLCGNKWRHHIIFRQAKLCAPTTMVYYAGCGRDVTKVNMDTDLADQQRTQGETTIDVDVGMFRKNQIGRIDVLVKPNAGGFGAGIRKISLPVPVSSSSSHGKTNPLTVKETIKISIPLSFEDGMALIQQYEKPIDGKIYRVWFLNGKVQCAVERKVRVGDETQEDDDCGVSSQAEFTSGCMGGNSCKFSPSAYAKNPVGSSFNSEIPSKLNPTIPLTSSKTPNPAIMLPWKVPLEVRLEIEDQLLPLLNDAHCGSVEFLYASSAETANIVANDSKKGVREKSNNKLATESTIFDRECPRRLYFDLNLLSTLPVIDNADRTCDETGATIWPQRFDPWLQLAQCIWRFFTSESEELKKRIKVDNSYN